MIIILYAICGGGYCVAKVLVFVQYVGECIIWFITCGVGVITAVVCAVIVPAGTAGFVVPCVTLAFAICLWFAHVAFAALVESGTDPFAFGLNAFFFGLFFRILCVDSARNRARCPK